MTTATQTANLFELACDGTRLSYSTSGIDGRPRLSYSDPEHERSFAGDEIESQTTTLGTEVTVTLAALPDLHTITATLLLPAVRLDDSGVSAFDTYVVKTTQRTTIAGPPLGPAQTYEAIALHGSAKAVVF